ncbi:phosphoribosylanthranilate isomerase [Bacteroidota bacterium]
MNELKIKICGMRDPGNIREIGKLFPDYMGFIYYPQSKRYAGELSASDISDLPETIQKTGVFVNTPPQESLTLCRKMNLDTVQLHGTESPDVCKLMRHSGLKVIKAFNIGMDTDFSGMRDYLESCDFFLLDTAGGGYGGTGLKFDWMRLKEYEFEKPFFLSGGIGPTDADSILELSHPELYGVDLNSRFEKEPGVKNRSTLEGFIERIRGKREF